MKFRLPTDVKAANLDSLDSNHIMVMLDYLGVTRARRPNPKEQRVALLRERIAAEPAKAQLAYDVIVLNKTPQATAAITADVQALKDHFYAAMRDVLDDDRQGAVRAKIATMAEELRDGLMTFGKQALAEAAKNYRPVVITEGAATRVVKGVLPKEFETMVQLCGQRIPLMLVGPAGCGKTYLASKVAEALGLKFYDQSCSEGVSESIFTGWLLPIEKGGAFEYVPSPFVTAYENGGVFLLDEIDAANPNLLTFLNKAIANDSFFLPQRYKNPLVKKHPDFVVIAAANTFGNGADGQYVGRNALDAATLDRFRAGMLHMDYSDEVETALVDADVLSWGRAIRKAIRQHGLRRIMSTRVLLDLTKMKRCCQWGADMWNKTYFADWSRDEMAKVGGVR